MAIAASAASGGTGQAQPSEETGPAAPDEVPGGARRRRALLVSLVVAVAALDQLTKVWAVGRLVPGQRVDLVGSVFGLRLVFNPGAALSMGESATVVVTVLAAVVVVAAMWWAWQVRSTWWLVMVGVLVGGAVGNLGDRFFRAPGPGRGHVVDFLDYGVFVGNVADIAIVVVGVAIVLLVWREVPTGRRQGRAR